MKGTDAPYKNNLRAVVEVIPMVASADPVVIGGGIVGLVVGVSGGVVQLAGLGVLASGLGVQSSSGLTVKSLEHFLMSKRILQGFYMPRKGSICGYGLPTGCLRVSNIFDQQSLVERRNEERRKE